MKIFEKFALNLNFEVKCPQRRYEKNWIEMKFGGLKMLVIMRFLEY